jgi:WD40 repeat protein
MILDTSSKRIVTTAIILLLVAAPVLVYYRNTLLFSEAAKWKTLGELPCAVSFLQFAPDGQRLISGDIYGNVKIWNYITGELIHNYRLDLAHNATAMATNGDTLAISDADGSISFQDTRSARRILQPNAHRGEVKALAFSSNSSIIASYCREDMETNLWKIRTVDGHIVDVSKSSTISTNNLVRALCFSPTSESIAVCRVDGLVDIWDLDAMENKRTLSIGISTLNTIAISPNGVLLAAGGEHLPNQFRKEGAFGDIVVRDLRQNYNVIEEHGLRNAVRTLCFSNDGTLLIAATTCGEIVIFDLSSGKKRSIRAISDSSLLFSMSLSSDDQTIAIGTGKGQQRGIIKLIHLGSLH